MIASTVPKFTLLNTHCTMHRRFIGSQQEQQREQQRVVYVECTWTDTQA